MATNDQRRFGVQSQTKQDRLKPAQRRFVTPNPMETVAPVVAPVTPAPHEFAPNNEKPYVSPVGKTWDGMAASDNPVVSTIGKGLGAFTRGTDQLQANIASGILQIPTDIPAMIDLVRVGVTAPFQAIPGNEDKPDAGYFERVGDAFVNNILSPEAQQELNDDMTRALDEQQRVTGPMSEEQMSAYLDQYQDTPEFFDLMTSKMSPGFKLGQMGNRWANEVAGVGRRPDEQTAVDDIEQLVGQAFIGLPKSVQKGLSNMLRDTAMRKVMDTTAGKVGTRVVEAVTPLTLPLTPANVGVNIAAGSALNEGIRYATNQPSLLRPEAFQPEEVEAVPELADMTPEEGDLLPIAGIEPADAHGENIFGQLDQEVQAGGLALGAFFGIPAFRRTMTTQAANVAKQAVKDFSLEAGPTLAEQSNRLEPIVSPVAGAIDSQAPLRRGANQFDLTPGAQQYVKKPEMLDAIDHHLSTASPNSIHDAVSNVENFGNLANFPDTIPLSSIMRNAQALPEGERDVLVRYAFAKQIQQDREIKRASVSEQLRQENITMQAAASRGATQAANNASKRIAELTNELSLIQADDPSIRNIMADRSMKEVNDIIRVAESMPEVMDVANAMRKSGHDMLNYAVKNGFLSSEEATIQAVNRDFYIPIRERSHPNVKNPVLRKGMLLLDRIKPKERSDAPYTPHAATRDLSARDAGKVNNPQDPIFSLHSAWRDVVQAVTQNNAKRQVIDTLRMFDGAEGKMFRQFELNGRKQFSTAEYFSGDSPIRNMIEGDPKHTWTTVHRNGKLEFYEWSDKSMGAAMEFAPMAVIPIVNASRKVWQTMTTGLAAPWFAVKAMTWDVPVARTTMKRGRSLGFLDTYARKLFNESTAINRIMDSVPDPTARLAVLSAIPYQLSARATRALGHKIADDLAANNGTFAQIAKVPGMRRFLDNAGTYMVKTFDRSLYGIMSRNLSTHMGLLADASKKLDDYNSIEARLPALPAAASNLIKGYKSIVESVQGATRTAFFWENYSRLKNKHNGSVPAGELQRLIKETRDLTGDMSKHSNNKYLSWVNSTIPYSNAAMQGTRHILGAAMTKPMAKAANKLTGGKANFVEDRNQKFWTQLIGGTVLPAVGAYAALEDWEGADYYWNNRIPEWKRMTSIPIPTTDALYTRVTTGAWPEFSPDKLTSLELAPEMSLFLNPIIAGMRSLGLMPNPVTTVPPNNMADMWDAVKQAFSFATPPVVKAGGVAMGVNIDMSAGSAQERQDLTFGGAQNQQRTYRSDMSRSVYDMIGALASSSGQLIAQTLDVFDMSYDETGEAADALGDALDTFTYEAQQKFPDVPGLFNVGSKEYAYTPESEYVFTVERALEPIKAQHSVEVDSKDRLETGIAMGIEPPKQITDPFIKQLSELVYDSLYKKGTFKAAAEAYTELNVQKNMVMANRDKYKAEVYHTTMNDLLRKQQMQKQIQASELTNLMAELQGTVGYQFEQQYGVSLSYDALAELVRKNTQD